MTSGDLGERKLYRIDPRTDRVGRMIALDRSPRWLAVRPMVHDGGVRDAAARSPIGEAIRYALGQWDALTSS